MTEVLDLASGDEGGGGAATIPVRYACEAVARLRLGAAARERLLQAAGIAPPLLRRAGQRLTGAQFGELYARAIRAHDDESLGWAARPIPRGAYAFLVRSLTGCADVAACIAQADAFYRLFEPRSGWELVVERKVATLRWHAGSAERAGSILLVHSMLLTPTRTAAWLTGQALPLAGVTLPVRFRAFAAETRFLFGLPPSFGSEAAIRFDARQLALPVIRGPGEVPAYLRASLRGFLLGAAGDPLESAVRAALAASRPFAAASVGAVARGLAMSRPTLARHLQRAGTSFAALRDELRRDHAIGLLSRGLRIADVAERLGYSEASAFQRAFKGWTGAPPGRVRARRSPPDA
jgi:AraC-like DNA-binding protein